MRASWIILFLCAVMLLPDCYDAAVPIKPVKCNCNCSLTYTPVCAVDHASGDRDTFPNECALQCYNCTHEKNYVITARRECSSGTSTPSSGTRRRGRGTQ
ncbi:Kazal peptide Pr13a-like [Periplaneta americana]|uniref:Kazal peptide Pr13a-like n=1 Tax=Periplaneta americana TaxID=6978 RepID=UPI0037E844B9